MLCSVTEPQKGYGFLLHPKSRREFVFAADGYYLGKLNVEGRHLAVTFHVPDCLDPPKKSFIWQGPVFLDDKAFHCQIKLVTVGPRDRSYLRRKAASPTSVGGIEVVRDEAVLGWMGDSSEGKGRSERIDSKLHELLEALDAYHPPRRDSRGREVRDIKSHVPFFAILDEAKEFVDSHPSPPDERALTPRSDAQ